MRVREKMELGMTPGFLVCLIELNVSHSLGGDMEKNQWSGVASPFT